MLFDFLVVVVAIDFFIVLLLFDFIFLFFIIGRRVFWGVFGREIFNGGIWFFLLEVLDLFDLGVGILGVGGRGGFFLVSGVEGRVFFFRRDIVVFWVSIRCFGLIGCFLGVLFFEERIFLFLL